MRLNNIVKPLAGAFAIACSVTALQAAPPTGNLRRWPVAPIIGHDPTQTVLDRLGITDMVSTPTAPLTNVTAYENIVGGGHLPCGITYWNPETDDFCWFGWTAGADRAVALAPPGSPIKTNTSAGLPRRTFRPGDAWNVVVGTQLVLHFQGTGSGVCRRTDPADIAVVRIYSDIEPYGITVDGASYDVWMTTTASALERLDPATNLIRSWALPGGGSPMNVAVDALRRPVFIVDGTPDRVMRLDPTTNTFTTWTVPGDGVGVSGFVSGGVKIDDEGYIIFAETTSGEVGVLNPTTDEMCEIGGGWANRLVSVSGTRGGADNNLQILATEGSSSRLTLITDAELTPGCRSCTTVAPTTAVVTPTMSVASVVDTGFAPTYARIPPDEFILPVVECEAGSGRLTCPDGAVISGVMRYTTDAVDTAPASMTEVVRRLDGTKVVYGTFEGTDNLFEFRTCGLIAPVDSCGDGVVDPGEACDDGNTDDTDGCRTDCTVPECGDGILDAGEECDDGNMDDDDGCRMDCTVPECGDGILDAGEECDDGNMDDDDGCRTDCTVPECGDGILDAGEACDDGNMDDDDGCRTDCTVPECGDGILDAGEECDDGNMDDDDGCRTDCTVPECGDGILDAGEECDDGNMDDDDGCRSDCTIPECGDGVLDTGEACDDGNMDDDDGCRTDCTVPECGDGILDAGEACDDGNMDDDDGCRSDCSIPECGDGILDVGEACDDGNMDDDDGCRSDCTIPECGDGILDAGEECDDGNMDDDDGCRSDCTIPECGDGILDAGEECDDGNTTSHDGCEPDCTLGTMAVSYASYRAVQLATGVELSWLTTAEVATAGFRISVRDSEAHERTLPGIVFARGPGWHYEHLDASQAAREGRTLDYKIMEVSVDGPGDNTPWFTVERPGDRQRSRAGSRTRRR